MDLCTLKVVSSSEDEDVLFGSQYWAEKTPTGWMGLVDSIYFHGVEVHGWDIFFKNN